MNGLNIFWILTSVGIMLFLIQAGFALIMRAERSGSVQKKKKEYKGSVLADGLVVEDWKVTAVKPTDKRKKKDL